jgi:hypothetical protein
MKGKIDSLKTGIQKFFRVFTGWKKDFLVGQNVINASVFPKIKNRKTYYFHSIIVFRLECGSYFFTELALKGGERRQIDL